MPLTARPGWHSAHLPGGMELENLRDFAKRHTPPVHPGQPKETNEGSGIAQTFSSQVKVFPVPSLCPLSVHKSQVQLRCI